MIGAHDAPKVRCALEAAPALDGAIILAHGHVVLDTHPVTVGQLRDLPHEHDLGMALGLVAHLDDEHAISDLDLACNFGHVLVRDKGRAEGVLSHHPNRWVGGELRLVAREARRERLVRAHAFAWIRVAQQPEYLRGNGAVVSTCMRGGSSVAIRVPRRPAHEASHAPRAPGS